MTLFLSSVHINSSLCLYEMDQNLTSRKLPIESQKKCFFKKKHFFPKYDNCLHFFKWQVFCNFLTFKLQFFEGSAPHRVGLVCCPAPQLLSSGTHLPHSPTSHWSQHFLCRHTLVCTSYRERQEKGVLIKEMPKTGITEPPRGEIAEADLGRVSRNE